LLQMIAVSVHRSVVLIGFSPPLVYCAIFSVLSSAVGDLHICICMRASLYQTLIVPVYAARRVATELTQFTGRVDLFSLVYHRMTRCHVTTTRVWFYDSLTSDFVE